MVLYEVIGKRLGFTDDKKPFFYISLFCCSVILVMFVYAILYDIPDTLKLKVCVNYVTSTPDVSKSLCNWCSSQAVNRINNGSLALP